MKKWENPELENLSINKTNEEGVEPYYYWPWSPACDDAANYAGDECPRVRRPCKYYKCGECTAPVTTS